MSWINHQGLFIKCAGTRLIADLQAVKLKRLSLSASSDLTGINLSTLCVSLNFSSLIKMYTAANLSGLLLLSFPVERCAQKSLGNQMPQTFFCEFKTFIARGNVIGLAVGIVIGASFTGIAHSLVKDIVNPLFGIVTGNLDFSQLFFGFKRPSIRNTCAGARFCGVRYRWGKLHNSNHQFYDHRLGHLFADKGSQQNRRFSRW